ncbi:tetratricopeptide repeat protein [Chryseobacterium sp. MIQD13]|uniref:tetratricopeptide repeat protein n=1 Tax=Chryseobacterium sp. MIQD13 TaxID=3422310 RepID=UPI003D2B16C1
MFTLVTDKNAYADRGDKELLRLCTEVYYQSKEIGYDKGKVNATVKMAEIYSNRGNARESLRYIKEGLEPAEKLEQYASLTSLRMIHGITMSRLGYYKKADKDYREALHSAEKIRDADKKHYIISNVYRQIADLCTENTKDSVVFYALKGYQSAQLISKKSMFRDKAVAGALLTVASGYFYMNDLSKAEKYLDEFDKMMEGIKDKQHLTQSFRIKGEIENKKKNYTKAIEYFQEAITWEKQYNSRYQLKLIYPEIADSYGKLLDYKNESLYLAKAKDITESLLSEEKKLLEQVHKTGENEDDSYDIFSDKKLLYGGLLSFFIISSLIIFFIIRNKKGNTKNENAAEDKIAAGHIPSAKNTIEVDSKMLNQVINLARDNDESFYFKFLELFPDFNQKLLSVNPQLTLSDLEYCALMKLNFDTKQIAVYKKLSISSVESKKYRIRKKLNITSQESIYTWFMKI